MIFWKKLEDGAPPRRRAPRIPSSFISALEVVVEDTSLDDRLRVGAWLKLLKIWASLRFDDAAHMRVDMVKSYEGKLSGLLKRTKTTGGGKRVKELPFHVSEKAWVLKKSWLATGMELLGRIRGARFELLLPAGVSQVEGPEESLMTYQEAVAWSVEVFRSLRSDDGSELIPEGWQRFWSEHSERSTLASGLAAIGVPKFDRDLLGRWKPEGSDTYIRTYNAVVTRMQEQFAATIRQGTGYRDFDEGAILEELKSWLVGMWGIDEMNAHTAVENWKAKLGHEFSFEEMVRDGGAKSGGEDAGGTMTPVVSLFGSASSGKAGDSSSSSSDESEDGEDGPKRAKARKIDRLSEERKESFVVVYNKIDRGKLHRCGEGGCWMAKKRDFKKATVYDEQPPQEMYTSRCMVCWPELKVRVEDSSDSEEELDLSVAVDLPKSSSLGGSDVAQLSESERLWS